MIKMRTNSEQFPVCCECGNSRDESLEMFDICIGGNILTICDMCNEALLKKTLKASCNVIHKIKSKHDIAVIRKRQVGKGEESLI